MIMNAEEYKKIYELLVKMPEEDKKRLDEILINHKEDLVSNPTDTITKCLKEMMQQDVRNFISEEL
ncbi:MAG: hypothetical protein K5666_03275 [Bacilli bacterium]|nr:hypothetical protein [Bacilli bacterium]